MALIWAAFFLSGVAGLSYELTWVRYLTHMFGASTPAVSATVSIFFSGLALGAWLGGRVFDRVKKILRSYALLELGIGLTAFTVPWLLNGADAFLNRMPDSASMASLLLVSLLALIVPTTLIGATFPAMAAVVRTLARPTSSTGLFYGFNTLGAVVGCILVSFWWLPSVGLLWTNELLVLINLGIAGLVLTARKTVFKGSEELSVETAAKKIDARQIESGTSAGKDREEHLAFLPAAALAGLSGFTSIAIEVLWVRALSLSYPGTVYVFAVVLAAYLIGIGVGSLIIGRMYLRRAPKLKTLWWLYLMVALGCVVTHNLISQIVPWSAQAFSRGWITSFESDILWVAATAMLSMLPTTLAMGAALPLLIGLSTRANEHAGRTAGRIYSVNTLCGVAGSLAATFGLMPLIGLDRSLMFLALAYIVSALALAVLSKAGRIPILGMASLIAVGIAISALDLQPCANYRKERPDKNLLYYKDSPSATVAVYEDPQGVRYLMSNNQYTQSTSEMSTVAMQYGIGHLPMLLHPNPKRALLIGFATGATLAAMGHEKKLKRLDCVEICDVIVQTAPFFESINAKIWSDPKVSIAIEDGRRFLSRPDGLFDVIVADLFFARNQGAGSLYSDEHFSAVARRLNKGGIFVSWLPLWQLSPVEISTIIRTYLKTFSEAEGWVGNWWKDTPILGLVNVPKNVSKRNLGEIERQLTERTEEMLASAFPKYQRASSGTTLMGFGERRLLDTEQLKVLGDEAPVNSLDFPVIEFSSPRSFMEDSLKGRELGKRNLEAIDKVRSLKGTAWEM